MKTPISYYGGKQSLLKYIIPLIPDHNIYTEAFCGGAAVFFAKSPVKSEVINDINQELINFYRIAKSDYKSLKAYIDGTIHSRDEHDYACFIMKKPQFFTPVQRAWAVWIRSKMSFASKLNGSFGYDFGGCMPKKVNNSKEDFTDSICSRLEHVTIENRDALQIIRLYDSPDTFHFIDPPYVGTTCAHYEGSFSETNLDELLSLLGILKGKFMFTIFQMKRFRNKLLKTVG